jgi:hypothetical protein
VIADLTKRHSLAHSPCALSGEVLAKLYVTWHRVGGPENVDGHARTTLVNAFLAERRSPDRCE